MSSEEDEPDKSPEDDCPVLVSQDLPFGVAGDGAAEDGGVGVGALGR